MAPPSNRHVYLSALVASQTGLLFGFSVGYIGGVIVLPSFLSYYHLDILTPHELASAQAKTVTAWILGALVGVPLGSPVISRLGRRSCLAMSAALYVVGASLQLLEFGSADLALFDGGRFINGLGVGAGTLVSPMYISEISPPSKRGMLLSTYQVLLQTGALLGFWAAYIFHQMLPDSSAYQWRTVVALQLVPGLLLLIGAAFIPEAPRYLAERGSSESALTTLAWIRGLPADDKRVLDELKEIEDAVEEESRAATSSKGFLAEVSKKGMRNRLGVGIGMMIAQNLAGLNALNYYAPTIFQSAGFTTVSASLFLTGLFGFVKLVSSLAFSFVLVQKAGNRFWLKFGTSLCIITMLVLAYTVRSLPPPSKDHQAEGAPSLAGVVAVLMVYIYSFAFTVSLGPISWNLCSEIFPAHLRAKCCGITTSTQWIFQLVIAYITPHLLASVGWATYLLYAVFCIVILVWVTACVPETRNVQLGREMDKLFGSEEPREARLEEASERSALLGRSL